jgi:tetratricopeptide (TPR) repeat protein
VKTIFWAAIVSCHCWAQADVPTANGGILDGLRGDSVFRTCTPGKGQPQVVCVTDRDGIAPPEISQKKPGGETISVRQLQHKVPKEAAKAFQRAFKLSGAGEHEKAAAELEAALRRDPEFTSAENQLGVEYSYLGRWEDAELAFHRVTDIEPASWMGHYNLALILYSRGDRPGAEQSARRALALSSENPRIHLLLGELLVMRNETRAEGLTELKFAARTLSDARWVLRVLGTP